MDLVNYIGRMFIITDLMILIIGATIIWLLYKTNKTIIEQKLQPVKTKREHVPVAKTKFNNALNPYEKYKDKKSNLYAPIKPKGGIELKKEDKE